MTIDIHSIPARVKASAIAVEGLRSCSLAIPVSETAIRQYKRQQKPIDKLIERGRSLIGFLDSSERQVMNSKPKNAKNIIEELYKVPINPPCSGRKKGSKLDDLKL